MPSVLISLVPSANRLEVEPTCAVYFAYMLVPVPDLSYPFEDLTSNSANPTDCAGAVSVATLLEVSFVAFVSLELFHGASCCKCCIELYLSPAKSPIFGPSSHI